MPPRPHNRILEIASDGEVLGEFDTRIYRRRWKWLVVSSLACVLGAVAWHYLWRDIDPIDDSDLEAVWEPDGVVGNAWKVWMAWGDRISIPDDARDHQWNYLRIDEDLDLELLDHVMKANRLSPEEEREILGSTHFRFGRSGNWIDVPEKWEAMWKIRELRELTRTAMVYGRPPCDGLREFVDFARLFASHPVGNTEMRMRLYLARLMEVELMMLDQLLERTDSRSVTVAELREVIRALERWRGIFERGELSLKRDYQHAVAALPRIRRGDGGGGYDFGIPRFLLKKNETMALLAADCRRQLANTSRVFADWEMAAGRTYAGDWRNWLDPNLLGKVVFHETMEGLGTGVAMREMEVVSLCDLLRVKCAYGMYLIAEGREPRDLDELVPRYLERLPEDPFDGGELKQLGHGVERIAFFRGRRGEEDLLNGIVSDYAPRMVYRTWVRMDWDGEERRLDWLSETYLWHLEERLRKAKQGDDRIYANGGE